MKGRLSKKKIFTKDPLSLTGIHSLTSSGLVNKKAVGVEAAPDNKGQRSRFISATGVRSDG